MIGKASPTLPIITFYSNDLHKQQENLPAKNVRMSPGCYEVTRQEMKVVLDTMDGSTLYNPRKFDRIELSISKV